MNSTDPSRESRTVLFLEKVFLEPSRSEPRGVEIFNINLLRDLARLGIRVTVVAHPDWCAHLAKQLGPDAPECLSFPRWLSSVLGVAYSLFLNRSRRFSLLLTANVGDRLIPAINFIRQHGICHSALLLAHREPTPRFVHAQGNMPTTVVAVNRKIASHFEGGHYGRVEVYYGVTDADRFLGERPPKPAGAPVEFCVIGDLNSAWKGADTAVEAFRLLESEVAKNCRLQLASFREPRTSGDDRIICHQWMPFAEMADFLKRMDVMLVPSRDEGVMRETFSQAAVQGMLSGLPLVVNDLPILMEKINDGGGLIAHSTVEMARAMTRLALDPDLRKRMGAKARATASARYIWRTDDFVKRFF